MAVTTWRNVIGKMQSAIATAVAITAVTKANPGVATSAAHGLSNGDILVLKSNSMHQINGRVVRVANKADDTFELEGMDTTLFDTFTEGTFEKVTMNTSVVTLTTLSASGGDFPFIATTTIHDAINKQVPDIPNPISYSAEVQWDPTNAGNLAMIAASTAQAQRVILFQFKTGWKQYFYGYVGYTGIAGGSAGAVVSSPAVFTIDGLPTYYAS